MKLWIVSVSESVDVRKTCRMGTINTAGASRDASGLQL